MTAPTTIPLAWLHEVGITRDHIAPACLCDVRRAPFDPFGRLPEKPTAIDLTRPGGMDAAARGLAVALGLMGWDEPFKRGWLPPSWGLFRGVWVLTANDLWTRTFGRDADLPDLTGAEYADPCEALAAAWAAVAAERGWA